MSNKRKAKPRVNRTVSRQVPREVVISYLCTNGAKKIREAFGSRCCVPACRVARQVLTQFGITSRFCAVKLDVLKDGSAFWIHGTGEFTQNGFHLGWDGHLVLVLDGPDGREILDLSLEQANRPGKGIVMRPLWADLLPDFWEKGESGHELNGCVVRYQRITSDGWRRMPEGATEARLASEIAANIRRSQR